MFRALLVAAGLIVATLFSPTSAAAAPCDDASGMSSIEYALDQIVADPLPAFEPGAACSVDADCKDTVNQKCEGGSCCVRKGHTCSGLGYCCGHPSQGCVDNKCPE